MFQSLYKVKRSNKQTSKITALTLEMLWPPGVKLPLLNSAIIFLVV